MRGIVLGLIALTAAGGAFAQEGILSGAQIAKAFTGRTISGVEDGERYAEKLQSNGDLVGTSAEGPYEGEWEVDGNEICFYYDDGGEDCSRVRLKGNKVTFMGDGEADTQAVLK